MTTAVLLLLLGVAWRLAVISALPLSRWYSESVCRLLGIGLVEDARTNLTDELLNDLQLSIWQDLKTARDEIVLIRALGRASALLLDAFSLREYYAHTAVPVVAQVDKNAPRGQIQDEFHGSAHSPPPLSVWSALRDLLFAIHVLIASTLGSRMGYLLGRPGRLAVPMLSVLVRLLSFTLRRPKALWDIAFVGIAYLVYSQVRGGLGTAVVSHGISAVNSLLGS